MEVIGTVGSPALLKKSSFGKKPTATTTGRAGFVSHASYLKPLSFGGAVRFILKTPAFPTGQNTTHPRCRGCKKKGSLYQRPIKPKFLQRRCFVALCALGY